MKFLVLELFSLEAALVSYFEADWRLAGGLHKLLQNLVCADFVPGREILDALLDVLKDLI